MKTLQQLYSWFILDNMSENSKFSDWKLSLRVAPLKKISQYENLEIDYEHFAFAERNNKSESEYFHWLKNFIRIDNPWLPPIFVFDNHNHSPIFRYFIQKKLNLNSTVLLHIDQHSDCWENKNHFELNLTEHEIEKVFHFFNEKCNVWNFILPSLKSWIISDQVQIRSVSALEHLDIKQNQNFILDIDLDFCLNGINRNVIDRNSVQILKNKFNELWKFAIWITIATSPYFLDQNLAINIVKTLLSGL